MFYKYPRTFHFSWSEGRTSDDKIMHSLNQFENRNVVITKKMDGENTTIYKNHIHARSLDSQHHVSRDWIKKFASAFQSDIPDGWRICGENLYAKHSMFYEDLESYFYGFSIWNENNIRLNWNETIEWFKLFNIIPVEVIYQGTYKSSIISNIQHSVIFNSEKDEGFVMTVIDDLDYNDFSNYTVKYVRANHVKTSSHWKSEEIIKNKLCKSY